MLVFTALAALRAPQGAIVRVAAQTFDLLRAIVLMFFVLLVLLMGREWKRHEFTVALGFGIYASALVAFAAIAMKTHYRFNPSANTFLYIAYDVVCFIWLAGFWRPEREAPNFDEVANPELLKEAKKWEGALKTWLTPKRR